VTGNVNEGTWHRNVQDPDNNTDNGTFKWTMSADGQSFTGEWHYDTGGCGSTCGWSGTCTAGQCLQNSAGGGGNCKALRGVSEFLGGTRADPCPKPVKFSFQTDAGLPDKPDDEDLPKTLTEIQVGGSGALRPLEGSSLHEGSGAVDIATTYKGQGSDKRAIEAEIRLKVSGPAKYTKKETGLRKVKFGGFVEGSDDDLCDPSEEEPVDFDGVLTVDEGESSFRLIFDGRCISSEALLWKPKNMNRASIRGGK
jgi:hypothetical protein